MPEDYAVLGGGVLGLTVALRLLQRQHRVTLFERAPLPGGLVAGFQPAPGIWLEKFYHHLFRSDRAIVGLIGEVGLGADLQWPRPVTATLCDGKIHQLDSAISLLRFRPLLLIDRLRMGMALAYLRALPSSDRLEGKTTTEWIRRTMGGAAYDTIWRPLLVSKFGSRAGSIALPWFWARVHDRTSQLGYLRGGFQRFYNRLAERLAELGGELRFSSEIKRIEEVDGRLRLTFGSSDAPEERRAFARVVSTLPTRLTCRLTEAMPAEYRRRYDWGEAYGAHCLVLALDRPLTSAYWINISDPGYPFMVMVEHTNYMPAEDYGGRHFIYLGNYRPMDDPIFRRGVDELRESVVPYLQRLNAAFVSSWIQQAWSFGAPFAQPVVTTDFKAHIPPFETPIDGLFVANMFQVYPHDRGQNYSVAVAEKLIAFLDAHR